MRSAHSRRDEMEENLIETRRRIAKPVKQMEKDDDLPRSVMTRLKDLECEEDRLFQELANLPERTVVRLPANYEAVYRSAVAELEHHLVTRDASGSRNAIRTLIEAVVVPVTAVMASIAVWSCGVICPGCWSLPTRLRTAEMRSCRNDKSPSLVRLGR